MSSLATDLAVYVKSSSSLFLLTSVTLHSVQSPASVWRGYKAISPHQTTYHTASVLRGYKAISPHRTTYHTVNKWEQKTKDATYTSVCQRTCPPTSATVTFWLTWLSVDHVLHYKAQKQLLYINSPLSSPLVPTFTLANGSNWWSWRVHIPGNCSKEALTRMLTERLDREKLLRRWRRQNKTELSVARALLGMTRHNAS